MKILFWDKSRSVNRLSNGLREAVDRAGTSKGAYIKLAMMEKIEREG